ncbi:MAG: N-acetyltransferase [Syntrophomonadaceae bacterium]|nr:N-acetyltransferase [Syntrophomonadaceae bacterium]
MKGYSLVSLKDMAEELGEKRTEKILSQFLCPLNKDVESFFHNSAISLAKQNISVTQLVFASYKQAPVIAGYFTLANKNIMIANKNMSNTTKKRISKFGVFDPDMKGYRISAPLIAQMGKNYANGYNSLITGDELLHIACSKVVQAQELIGGKIVYLECEDKIPLIDFYQSNGFVNFGHRALDRDETAVLTGQYLIQMLKYLK